jgi:hypothetical protein
MVVLQRRTTPVRRPLARMRRAGRTHVYFCAPPGGTNSSAFDPVACGVAQSDGGEAACAAQCAAWFAEPVDVVWCAPADGYADAGPAGWKVCMCNVP